MKKIYLDHSATTPMDPKVLEEMNPYMLDKFGNSSSPHSYGQEAKEALEESRAKISKMLGASQNGVSFSPNGPSSDTFIFTSGGSESDNLAIIGSAMANKGNGNHIITSSIEHHAVLHPCEFLEKNGFEVTYIPVSREGYVSPEDVENALRKNTILITIMHANNEIGTIQPLREIGKIANEKGVLLHTDAVQTAGKIPLNVNELGVDLLSLSAHKFYGPKGTGALFVRQGTKLEPQIHGGGHERGLRSGTENVPGAVGTAKALEICLLDIRREMERERGTRDRLIDSVLQIKDSRLNGAKEPRLPGNANFSFKFIEGESMLLYLDQKGIAVSTGSACSSGSLDPSHVLTAIGLKPEEAHGSLRVTLGKGSSEEHIDYLLKELPPIVEKLREMSPVNKGNVESLKENPEEHEH